MAKPRLLIATTQRRRSIQRARPPDQAGSDTAPAPGDGPRDRSRIATLPLGYADGIACSGGNRAQVWIAGERRPIAGRVSMDYIGVDVSGADVAVGDEAVIFGNAGLQEAGISVEEAAEWSGTIPYELLVRVGNRIPRRMLD